VEKQTILFNLDDTLAYCNRYFNQVIGIFVDQMTAWFDSLTKEEIRQKQLEIDLEAISAHGLRSDRFPESFVNSYYYFCDLTGKEKKKSNIEFLRELDFKVFKIPVEPIPFIILPTEYPFLKECEGRSPMSREGMNVGWR
jgi:putative hydrolase of the HAD superfamily